ncbi:hypothetical protein [Nostoc sphaeroides]|uniref:Uncharacterized protein n=1 Tax=Nostoc sphaeroides CCNUC1 TaxID=2653204 RepID=A0A5P8VYW4_9NOSO|nr:hypothetical protein [Nostoc sphaeroides]QFS45511.1 hypothetical protein GXM_02988 [Nostoc sphaeroides CCNUC1]
MNIVGAQQCCALINFMRFLSVAIAICTQAVKLLLKELVWGLENLLE